MGEPFPEVEEMGSLVLPRGDDHVCRKCLKLNDVFSHFDIEEIHDMYSGATERVRAQMDGIREGTIVARHFQPEEGGVAELQSGGCHNDLIHVVCNRRHLRCQRRAK